MHELFDRELVIRSASGDELAHMGWIDMNVSLRSDKQGLNVPFLVTRVELDKPILRINVIKKFINDAYVKYIFPNQEEKTVNMGNKTLHVEQAGDIGKVDLLSQVVVLNLLSALFIQV